MAGPLSVANPASPRVDEENALPANPHRVRQPTKTVCISEEISVLVAKEAQNTTDIKGRKATENYEWKLLCKFVDENHEVTS